MFFNLFKTLELAIDLGTANTIIIIDDQIVVDEPSIIAINRQTGEMVAVGKEAQMMHGKTHENIKTLRPLRNGVIADFEAAEMMIRAMIAKAKPHGWFTPAMRMVIGIPSGSTEVERRAVMESAEQAGAREVYLIQEPMAAALGIGLDVQAPKGNMIVDIGGGTTEIAVISLGGIVANRSITIAGDEFTEDIKQYMRRQHNIHIFERTAEEIKIKVGAATLELDDPPADFIVRGPHQMTALPVEIAVSYKEIAQALDKSISKIENAILNVLETTPPELYSDIFANGIWLTGGGALLRGLDKRLSEKTRLPVKVAEDPLHAVARGTAIALKNYRKFPFLISRT